jgi:tRNA threonylcarbamoyladenosine biosynthesis protein TsaB
MILLGFDTATSATAVALCVSGRTSELRDDPAPGAHPGHATRLLAIARELLEREGLGWSALERIAVGVGPGTFTGLRVGVATARGLALSLQRPLVGVSSLAALADPALAEPDHPLVMAVIDARRGEVFAAAYGRGEDGLPRELTIPLALAPEDLGEARERAEELAGAPLTLAVGDGALRYAAQLRAAGIELAPERSRLHLVSAASVCALGERATAAGDPRAVEPDYRRRPDAELTLLASAAAAAAGGAS